MPLFHAGLLIGGKYRVIRRIGAGGMGAVFEVENTALGGRAALKVLTINIHDQPEYFARFQNEARAANQSGHPCVVPVYDFGQLDDGTPWLVMPFLVGETLSARIARAKRSPQGALGPDSLWMIGDIASALRATHLHGIVHRDLKPANVMLVTDPSTRTGERAMVLDFGIAKLHCDHVTRAGAVLGTPVYMALEQFQDSATVDGKADVYSLGCIAYQIVTGRLPHEAGTAVELMSQRMVAAVPRPSTLVPAVPVRLEALVMAMLAQEPPARPTMAEVEESIRQALTTPARPLGPDLAAPAVVTAPVPSVLAQPPVAAQRPPQPAAPPTTAPLASPRQRRVHVVAVALLAGVAAVSSFGLALRKKPAHSGASRPTLHSPAPAIAPAKVELPPAAPPKPTEPPAALAESPAALAESPAALAEVAKPAVPKPAAAACEPQGISEGCTFTPQLLPEQRAAVVSALRHGNVKLCGQDRLVLSGIPRHPRIRSAPPYLSRQQPVLLYGLRALPGVYPTQVEIQCRRD
jgi:serine/threonine protein kinase